MSSILNKFASYLSPYLKPQRKRYRYLRDGILLLVIAFVVLSYQQRNMVTGKAPALSGITTTGKNMQLSKDQVTLVYFWGTWCPVCRVTSPMVNEVAKHAKVISIAVASGTDIEINQFMTDNGYQFDVINDSDKLPPTWGATVFPAIYIVDTQGQIRFKTSGATSSWGMKLRLYLASW